MEGREDDIATFDDSKGRYRIVNLRFALKLRYGRSSLFADLLSANSLIHIGKIGQKCLYSNKKWTFSLPDSVFAVQNENASTRITRENLYSEYSHFKSIQ